MEDMRKDLSVKIMELLKPILPPNAGFIMVCGDLDSDLGITSNLSDDLAIQILQEAIYSIKTEPAVNLESAISPKNTSD